jgi:hypothetical protein
MSDLTCAERERSDETLYTCQLNQQQIEALASGFVPASVKSVMFDFLTWQEQEEAKAKRPERKRKKTVAA